MRSPAALTRRVPDDASPPRRRRICGRPQDLVALIRNKNRHPGGAKSFLEELEAKYVGKKGGAKGGKAAGAAAGKRKGAAAESEEEEDDDEEMEEEDDDSPKRKRGAQGKARGGGGSPAKGKKGAKGK